MKVILRKDVKGIGRAHETVDARDGYALNYLIAKGFAIAATGSAVKEAEARKSKANSRKEVEHQLLAENIASLAEARIVIKAKVNEKGHLYDAVGESEIRQAAEAQARITLPEGAIKLEKPIKEVGTVHVPVAVGEIFGQFSVTVEAEA